MSSEAMQPKHETFRLSELRDLVATGRVRIPDFQRSFRWTNQDVVALFDSLHHGYPIGNLLMWKREAPAQRLTSTTGQNCMSKTLNAPGTCIAPSQCSVLLLS